MRPVAFSVMLMLGMVIVLPNPVNIGQANADIHADPTAPKNQQPIILSAPNGVEVVNIRTPSAAGVSRNTYSQFDVPRQGAIINNSRTNVQSQLGGWLQGNPFLAAGTARVIFNEVNSNNPSYLNGYIEIAGSRAEFILANPNGITCNGCGFINAYRPVLTTGTPIFNGGDLAGYRVHGGDINIIGDGLDASNANYTDIIARTVNVHAGIWADNLAITTGINEVNAANTQVTAMAGTGSTPAPSYALDVASLGGMYAKKITMIGTEAGLGVRNAGVLNAYAGSLTIDVNGNLINSNTIIGSTQTNIQAHDIHNTAANIVSAEQLNINANSLSGDGKVLAGGDATINLLQDYTHTVTAELQANGNLSLSTSGNIVNASKLLAGQTLTLNAYDINNTALGEISAYRTHLNVDNNFTNRGLIDGAETFIDTHTLHNIGTGTIYGNHIALAADTLNNQDETNNGITSVAVIAARERLDIGAKNINNLYDSQIFSAGDLYIQGALNASRQATGSAGHLLNNGGVIEAFGSVTLHVDDLQNLNSNLTTQKVLIATDKIDRFTPFGQSVVLESSDYPGARIGNVGVATRTAGPYSFREYYRYLATATTDETQIVTTNPGQILSGTDMTIVGNVFNHDSEIIAGGDLNLDLANLDNKNSQGTLIKRYTNNIKGEGAFYYDYDGKGRGFRYKIKSVGAYTPADEVTTFNLPTAKVLDGITFSSNGTDVGVLNPGLLPGSRLYQLTPDTAASYLIETDPRFANYRTWLSSDYLLNALSYDPTTVTKRLGDGFYEQRLIREQINQLTGKRFLTGYANDEQQYQALMINGTTFAQAHQLIPGVALTEAQVAQLTSDIVWLVEQTVSLPDGTTTQALVPQVYVRLQPGDINGNGGLLAGESIHLNVDNNLTNSGTIAGRSLTSISADNIHNLKGRISGNITALNATQDINNLGGSIEAKDTLLLQAGKDINIASTTQSSQNTAGASSFTRTNIDRVAGLYVTNPNGILVAAANNNINLQAAQISNSGTGGATLIDAGNNLNLTTITTAEQNNMIKDSKNYIKYGNTQEIGTGIQTSGDLTLSANNNLTARAAVVSSESGKLTANAQNNLTIESGIATSNLSAARTTKKSGTFSSKKTERRDTFNDSEVVSSSFSGNTVNLNATNDLTVTGSNVVGTNNVNLNAKNNLNIEAAQATHDESHYNKEKKSGFSASSTSVGYGSSKLTTTNDTQSVTNVGSTIGSVEGNININSGKDAHITASDILTPKGDINITAKNVDINSATDTYANQQSMRYKQSGITLSVGSSALNLAQNVVGTAQGAVTSDGNRNKALNALQTYANGATLKDQATGIVNAAKAGNIADAASAGGVKISLSIGSSSAKSSSSTNISTQQDSLVKAGGDVNIKATQEDITVKGSQIEADKNITLEAAKNLNLIASADNESNRSQNKSSSTSIGVSVGIGSSGAGLSVGISASRGKGSANSDSTTYNNTHVTAGETITLVSGDNTNLTGANAEGKKVIANVGGDLNIQSLQDIATSKAKQSNTGISISVPVASPTLGNTFAGVSQSKQKSNSNYASVYEQSGIKAGDQGFNITAQGNTDLKGAIIESAATPDKNSLTTGTLTTSNIENHMQAEASSSGTTLSTDMLKSKYAAVKGVASNLQNHGEADVSDSSTTSSAISPANISITDKAKQQQLTGKTAEETVVALNRDTTNTNRVLAKPDVQALQEKAQQEQADRMLAVTAITAFSDEAYRSRLQATPKVFKVECPAGSNCQENPKLLVRTEINPKDVANVPAGSIVAVNGIFNNQERGAELAYQNTELITDPVTGKKDKPTTVYLMHIAPATNAVSEFLGVAYEKIIASSDYGLANFLGYTNGQELYADLLRSREQQATESLGHSRGTLVQEGAFAILGNRPDKNGNTYTNSNLIVRGVGGAADAVEYTNKAIAITGEKDKDNITYNYFSNDPVSTSSVTGGNIGIWTLKDLWQVYSTDNSMHSCYGTGAKGCTQVEIPVPGGPQGTPEGNAKLIQYQGGKRIDNNPVGR